MSKHRSARSADRRAERPGEPSGPPLEHGDGFWRIRSDGAARAVLHRRSPTAQAGFAAEMIPSRFLRSHPILLSDGERHDAQRRAVGSLLAPGTIDAGHQGMLERTVERQLQEALDQTGGIDPLRAEIALDEVALLISVEVTRRIVGLTHAPLPEMAARLERFMDQPPMDLTRPRWGRTRRQWAQAAVNGLGPLAAFWHHDVRPALRARRAERRDDLISQLLDQGCSAADVLVECVTYATAGMITTREFMVVSAWHVLERPALAARMRLGSREERFAILREIIRLEPVVGHLLRRARAEVALPASGDSADAAQAGCPAATAQAGELLDLCIRDTNTDPAVYGQDADCLRPSRDLPRGISPAGLSFGAGPHRCPGEHLALAETDALLRALLRRPPVLVSPPDVDWEDLAAGYVLRGMRVELSR